MNSSTNGFGTRMFSSSMVTQSKFLKSGWVGSYCGFTSQVEARSPNIVGLVSDCLYLSRVKSFTCLRGKLMIIPTQRIEAKRLLAEVLSVEYTAPLLSAC